VGCAQDSFRSQQTYTFQELGQRELCAPCARRCFRSFNTALDCGYESRGGMANPLLEACLVRTGTRLAFRHMAPWSIPSAASCSLTSSGLNTWTALSRSRAGSAPPSGGGQSQQCAGAFSGAVQAEEAGEKQRAIALYEEILKIDPQYAAAYINLGTINFHLRASSPERGALPSRHEADPGYVLAFFDLGNVLDELQRLDESIAAYRRAVALAPRYADAHYNLALAYERTGEHAMLCATGRPTSGSTTPAHGPITPRTNPQAPQPRKALHRLARKKLHSAPQGIGGAGTGEQLTSLIRPFSAPDIHR